MGIDDSLINCFTILNQCVRQQTKPWDEDIIKYLGTQGCSLGLLYSHNRSLSRDYYGDERYIASPGST